MSATAEEAMRLLREIHAMLRTLTTQGSSASLVASDADLDGEWGNPLVKAKSPKDWTGESMTGKRFSECPAAYLDLVAERLDYFASKEPDEKKRGYNRKDAARARGWAARLRAGWTPPPTASDWTPEELPQW